MTKLFLDLLILTRPRLLLVDRVHQCVHITTMPPISGVVQPIVFWRDPPHNLWWRAGPCMDWDVRVDLEIWESLPHCLGGGAFLKRVY